LSTSGAANAPLIVLDGIIYTGSIVDLNTADIESIDVLKDVSASAVYGTQGANGVILITTKSGSKQFNKPTINYSSTFTLQNPSNKLEPMNAEEYEEFYPDVFWARGGRLAPDYLQVNPDYDWRNNFKALNINEGYANGADYPWWDSFKSNGQIQSHNISLQGRNENLTYFLSGGFTDQDGYLRNDDYSKYNFRINIDAKVTNWLNVGTQTFATISDYSGVTAGNQVPFLLQPWAQAYNSDEELVPQPEGGWLSPYLIIQQDNSDIRTNLFSNLFAKIKLPLEGLTFETKYSNNYRRSDYSIFNPHANSFQGAARKTHGIFRSWTWDNIVNYTKTFNNDHNVNVTLLYGAEERTNSSTTAASRNFEVDFLGYNRLEAGDPTLNSVNSDKWVSNSIYQMARLLYNYKYKYFLTATIRRDGFSGFGRNNKIATFPSVGLAWTLSEETFMQNVDIIDYLKLKASYGQTGRRGISPYSTLAKVSSGPSMVFGDGGETFLGQSIVSLANDNLRWETTTGFNGGLDFEVLNSRLSGSFDYYENTTEDILFSIVLPRVTGFNSIADNIAEVSNNGIDVSLSGTIVKNNDWNWTTSVVYSRSRNKIESIIGADNDGDGIEDDLVSSRLFIGEPQTVLYHYEIEGMWQLADQENGSIWPGFLPGTYKLKDISGPDGEPDGTISSLYDQKILGYTDPAYRVGVTNNVSYKNWNLYVFINSIQGGKDRYYGSDDPNSYLFWNNADQLSYSNVPKGAWDYWMPENPDAKYRRLDTGSSYGGIRYTQRSFIRLQDVSLSYTIPKSVVNKLTLNNVKVFVSGKNLFTITDWAGWDPETGVGFTTGVPLMRSYTIGLNVEL
ncbi:MAG TPA: SusC/RagA family TonB-linked outer membrane protein, partial [Bacteroidales bacterium]|nr:SusC/RagA family TonB-linked outer membrane protein [Bacteroidales bacterium]